MTSGTSTIWPISSTKVSRSRPLWIQSVFGILGGIGADPDNVTFMRRTADRLFGKRLCLVGARRGAPSDAPDHPGGHAGWQRARGSRGLLYIGRGRLAGSNAEQVLKIRRILEELGFGIATPDEARQMLALKGRQQVEI